MTNHKLGDFNLSVGLCEVTFGNTILPSMGSEGTFQAIPTYSKVYGGRNQIKKYLLEKFDVSFEVSFDKESIEMMKIYMPTLISYENGLYDNPQNVSLSKNQLVIHPYTANTSKQYDICIWNAYIDPETGFQRVYGKETNKYKVKFIGKAVKSHTDTNIVDSYFYIGDWSKVGVPIA
jgi:hypothetical protein